MKFVPTAHPRGGARRAGRAPRRARLLRGDLARRALERGRRSPAPSCRTTTRARAAARCAACTRSACGPRASWCAWCAARSGTWRWTCGAARRASAGTWPSGSRPRTSCSSGSRRASRTASSCSRTRPSSSTSAPTTTTRADELRIAWNDPALAIPWPIAEPLLSEPDRRAPRLAELEARLPRYGGACVRILLTGAGGQLGLAVRQVVRAARGAAAHARRARRRRRRRGRDGARRSSRPSCVLNAAAYTAVDRGGGRAGGWRTASTEHGAARARGGQLRGAGSRSSTSRRTTSSTARRARRTSRATPTHPLSVYGASKLAGEEEVRRANPRHWIVRTAWLYGPVGKNFALSIRAAARASRGSAWWTTSGARRATRRTWPPRSSGLIESDACGTHHLANAGIASRFEFARALLAALGSRDAARADPDERLADAARAARATPRSRASELRASRCPTGATASVHGRYRRREIVTI